MSGMTRYELGTGIGLYVLDPFNPVKVDILQWLNSFEYIVDITNLNGNEKVNFLLNMLDSSVFNTIREQSAPSNPFELSYEVLVSQLETSFSYFQGEFAANYRFYSRDQLPDESIEHFVLTLRKLSCKCSASLKTNDSLKTRFVDGLYDKETRRLLVDDEIMTFGIAVAFAKHMELAKKNQMYNYSC